VIAAHRMDQRLAMNARSVAVDTAFRDGRPPW